MQVRIAAFAMSSYALSYHRVGRKPFNPILGETYEWVREDKGFKFIAEQVRGMGYYRFGVHVIYHALEYHI